MNTKKFSEAMGEIDDKYVDEAIQYQSKKKKRGWLKWGAMAACLCLVVCAIAIPLLKQPTVTPGDLIPMVFVNDTMYYQSSNQSFIEKQDDFVYLGNIESEVAPSQKPTKELQANHSIVGAEVYQYEKDIVVLINGKYWLYEYADE